MPSRATGNRAGCRLTFESLEHRRLLAVLSFDYVHNVEINGQQETATAKGTLDSDTGAVRYDGSVSNYIDGYAYWPVSWLTLVVTSGGPIFALERDAARNIFSLTDGQLDYSVQVQTQDEFADIATEIQIRMEGDTVFAELTSEGVAKYPTIMGMVDEPMVFTQTPTNEGFVEQGAKRLLAEDGTIIETQVTANFQGVPLPNAQVREVSMDVLAVSDDFKDVSIQLTSEVRPAEDTLRLNYTHNVLINGAQEVATATGTFDRATGAVRYDGSVSNYIDGYAYWPVSWLTLVVTSGGPIFALERDAARNIFSLTDGQLDYSVQVQTQDEFADIATEIQIRMEGDTVFAELTSEGVAKYPTIMGMVDEPMVFTQTPTNEGFVEQGAKRLLAEDGTIIETQVTANFQGVPLPNAQVREVSMDVLAVSDDFKDVSIQLTSEVRPAEDTLRLNYTHNVLINGAQEVATATGTFDRATGAVRYDGSVSNYIDGYAYWPVSWLTLVVTSGGPIFALERDAARNIFSLTDGQLDYSVQVQTQDEFADIATEIQIRMEGDTVFAELTSEGVAKYPTIMGMVDEPMVFTQTPTNEGFVEQGAKRLLAEDGTIIETQVTANFQGVPLPNAQVREVSMDVLAVSDDFKDVSIQLTSEVRPRDIEVGEGPIPGDVDGNGIVEFGDFLTLSGNFGQQVEPGTGGDFDNDGTVTFGDFLVLSSNFGKTTAVAVGREQATKVDAQIIAEQLGWSLIEATEHMKVQDEFGFLISELAVEFKDSYAGGELTRDPGGPSTVRFKGPVPEGAVQQIEDSGLPVEIIDNQPFSEIELHDRTIEVVRVIADQGFEEIGGAVLADGLIDITVRGQEEPKLPDELAEGVRISLFQEPIVSLEHTRGGALVRGSGSCTSGFTVRSLTTGVTGVTTAGHCTAINTYTQPLDGVTYSLFHQSQHLGLSGDVEWKTSPHIEPAEYFATSTQIRNVDSVESNSSFANNNIYCVYGRASNNRRCDRVYSTFVVSFGPGFNLIGGLVAMDNDNTIPGDSGGPWSFGTEAAGTHRGDQWIWFGTRNIFSKAALLPSALGVAVRIQPSPAPVAAADATFAALNDFD